uniref:hypoxia-inducible factor-proline dioxygenase n=1 Tax=Panagrellus redivivus TaxID=6233 RepID=A0A7E4VV87_PANRE
MTPITTPPDDSTVRLNGTSSSSPSKSSLSSLSSGKSLKSASSNSTLLDICSFCGIKFDDAPASSPDEPSSSSGPGKPSTTAAKQPQPHLKDRVICSECTAVAYCSIYHKESDSTRHRPVCAMIKATKSGGGDATTTTATTARASSESAATIATMNAAKASMEQRHARKRAANPHIQYKDHSKNLLFKSTLQDHMRSLAASGLALNQHQAIALRLRYLAEHVIRGLNEYGWAVCDNFLGETHCNFTYREVERLYQRGHFSAGELMDQKEDSQSQDIRSDQILWFDGSDTRVNDCVTVRLLISMIDSVIVHFKDRIPPYTISGRSRAMIACYPGSGTRYVRHVDNPVRDGRCITSIYYCNEDWKLADHGGTLRLYPETSLTPMDIDPQADRLVFFWSDRRNPHEVLPVYRHRYAITIWYFDHNEKMEALERRRREAEKKAGPSVSAPNASATSSPTAVVRARSAVNVVDWQGRQPAATAMVNASANVIPPGHLRNIQKRTNSDSFSTGSADDNIEDPSEPEPATTLKPEYQI